MSEMINALYKQGLVTSHPCSHNYEVTECYFDKQTHNWYVLEQCVNCSIYQHVYIPAPEGLYD